MRQTIETWEPRAWKDQTWFFLKDGTAVTEELLYAYWDARERDYFSTFYNFLEDIMLQNYVDSPTCAYLKWEMPMFSDVDTNTIWHPYELLSWYIENEDTSKSDGFMNWLTMNMWQSGGNLESFSGYWAFDNAIWDAYMGRC